MAFAEIQEPGLPQEISVIFAFCAGRGGRCGLAYVDLDETERVLRAADVLDPEFTEIIRLKERLLCQSDDGRGPGREDGQQSSHLVVRSGLCVVPSRSPPQLLQCALSPVEESGDSFPTATQKAGDFDVEASKLRLVTLFQALQSMSKSKTSTSTTADASTTASDAWVPGQTTPLATLDLGNEQLVRAAGGLLRFLEQNRKLLGQIEGQWQPCVQDVKLFAPEDSAFVDVQTLMALQVVQEHRQSLMRLGKPREGLSLLGLLEPFVSSTSGRIMLRRWLHQPSRNVELLKARHDAVESVLGLLRGSGAELVRQLHRELKEVQDVPAILSRLYRCYHFDNVGDWRALAATLSHMSTCLELITQASNLGSRGLFFSVQGDGLAEDVQAAESLLQRVVDWDGHFTEGHFDGSLVHVQRGVDRRLDGLRQQYLNIESHLSDIASLEKKRLLRPLSQGRSSLQRAVDSVLFHYFPQLGFHASLPNPMASSGEVDADAMDFLKRKGCIPLPAEDWSYQFAGGPRLFYKCDMARRLDTEIGDLVLQARDVELQILGEVLERIRRLEGRLRKAAQLLAEVDVIQAFSSAALQYKWNRPKFSAKPGLLHIVRGRHPLVEAMMTAHHGFVPNSTEIGLEDREYRVQVVTGANLAGKSVYLKQVGLITYMAHTGSFVPADEAELGLCDFIFSRIQSCDSATRNCSTFTLDLCQLSLALKHATASSLILIDEFGKGTRAVDGVALLGATVEYFCRWANGPKVLITTHFTEIFRMNLVSQSEPFLQVSHLRILPPDDSEGTSQNLPDTASVGSIAYLYQMATGCSEKSFGLECAAQAGLDSSVISRAANFLAMLESGNPEPEAQATPRPKMTEQQQAVCQMIVDRLCALDLDTDDEDASKALLAFVASKADEISFGECTT